MDKLAMRGFSTIELMIAMTIMILTLTAVTLVSFGNQGFLVGAQVNAEAMNRAQEMLEQEQALARKDFNLVNPVASTTDDIYTKAIDVQIINSPSSPDYLMKEVRALISWKDERGQTRLLNLNTLVSNFETPTGNNTCDSTVRGAWQSPQIINGETDFATLVGDPFGTYTIGDLDAYRGKLYVVAANTSAPSKETFFVFDISNPAAPLLRGKIDNALTVNPGFSAVRVSEDPASNPVKTYAYAASNANSDYTTCNPVTNPACGELVIFDVTDGANPTVGTNLMLASSTAPFVKGNQARGRSIFYRNGYVLLGLSATGAGNGPEFHILDVHNPTALFGGTHVLFPVGSFLVANDINALSMRGTYAYLDTPNTQELQVLNITNPNTPTLAGSFNSPSGTGHGKSMYLVGNRLYLGKTVPNAGNDFHILDITTPAAALPELGGMSLPSSVNAIVVRDYLSFLLTRTDLQIFKTDNPGSISTWGSMVLPASGHPTEEPSMDCEGNYLYVSSNDAGGKGKLYVITSSP